MVNLYSETLHNIYLQSNMGLHPMDVAARLRLWLQVDSILGNIVTKCGMEFCVKVLAGLKDPPDKTCPLAP